VDLVLMDIMMPEMDGLTAMREIRKLPTAGSLPIIALTAKAMPEDRRASLDAGANDYIAKPIDIDRLLSLCRVWMPK
jgi:CheY-like chemotaxis protein